MRLRLTTLTLAAVAALLAVPAAAPAAVTCDYSSSGKILTVALDAAGDTAVLSVAAGEIRVGRILTQVACTGPGGPPTVTNTGVISVTGTGANAQKLSIGGAADFVPGPDPQDGSDSGGGTKEIEIFVNLNGGLDSTLEVGTGDSGRLVFGANGINPNPVGETLDDADIFPNNVEQLAGVGGAGNDELGAQGGQGTGGVLTADVVFLGHGGTDQIEGGQGADSLFGGPGGDTLFGGAGGDVLHPEEGNDVANGSAGTDTVAVSPVGQPATVDLAITVPQDTGDGSDTLVGFENARSDTTAGATLRGDDGGNVLTGGEGNDTLEGRGGIDVLSADLGEDTLLVRDGGLDGADCGADADTVIADPLGVDTLTGCETAIFPPPPGAGGGGDPGGESGGGGQAAAFGARTLVTLTLARIRIPAMGPLAVRVSNANSFAVSGTLAGRRARLRAKSFEVPANARKTVRLRLPRTLRRQLARRRRLVLGLSASVRDPAGNTRTVRRTIRPRLKPAR
jgi:Ca2+-binding RTX toxin-like protein